MPKSLKLVYVLSCVDGSYICVKAVGGLWKKQVMVIESVIGGCLKMKRFVIVINMCLIVSSMLFAGPFGLEFGWTYDEVVSACGEPMFEVESDPGVSGMLYEPESMPKRHQSFDSYILFVDHEYGLVKIVASEDFSYVSGYGYELVDEFDKLERQLSSVYGEGRRYDFLYPDSIWDRPSDFMMSLYFGDRSLATYWVFEDDVAPNGDELACIAINVVVTSSDSATIDLTYEHPNFYVIQERSDAEDVSALCRTRTS